MRYCLPASSAMAIPPEKPFILSHFASASIFPSVLMVPQVLLVLYELTLSEKVPTSKKLGAMIHFPAASK